MPDRTLVTTRTRTRTRSRERGTRTSQHPARIEQPGYLYSRRRPTYEEGSIYSDGDYAGETVEGPQLSPTDPRGFRELFARDCLNVVDQRIAEFEQFHKQAFYLGQVVS